MDELNAFVGMAAISAAESRVRRWLPILRRVQHELFNLGSILATQPEDVHPKQARVTEAEVRQLEIEIDRMNADLAPLRSFVLPGGTRLNTELHACRTICRRAERLAVSLARDEADPAGDHSVFESPERCFFRLEPLGESRARRSRGSVGAEPIRFRNVPSSSSAASSEERPCFSVSKWAILYKSGRVHQSAIRTWYQGNIARSC